MTYKTLTLAAASLLAVAALPLAAQAQVAASGTQMTTQASQMWQLTTAAASRTVVIEPVTQDIASSIGAFYSAPRNDIKAVAVSQPVSVRARTTNGTDHGRTLFGDVKFNNDQNFTAIPERGSAPSRADTRYTVIRTGVSLDF